MSDLVLLDVREGVATLTLNRPEKLNAFGGDMRERLGEALDRVVADPGVRVLVITGAGRAFCAGGDVGHMVALRERDASFEEFEPMLDAGRVAVTRLAALGIPTVARVNGAAAGAGLNLALACDLRVASDQATFGETFVRLGLHPDWGGTYSLVRHVGLSKALELCWLGDMIDAAEALRIGLVNRVVPHAALDDEVGRLAARLAAAPRTSLRLIKRTLTAAPYRTLAECIEAEVEAVAVCWETEDVAEGVRAFVEKRAPRFGGAVAAGSARVPGFE
jgi:2-(1,2-epoxy-1,2-dihydrophenyl)acetyl-CoA isomerase